MKSKILFSLAAVVAIVFVVSAFQKNKGGETWTKAQLMAPSVLAEKINKQDKNVVVFDIGPAGTIKNAVKIGAAEEKENFIMLKNKLAALPKTTEVVVYCGCCPFENCPNVRPAFKLTQEMGFKNAKLLNLSKNLKVDWIDKGYPMAR